jgi:hypothetical protein
MIDSVQEQVTHLDQEVQNLIDCCNSMKEVIEVKFDDVRRDCEIFAQQVIGKTSLRPRAFVAPRRGSCAWSAWNVGREGDM